VPPSSLSSSSSLLILPQAVRNAVVARLELAGLAECEKAYIREQMKKGAPL
jgi:hypothetical protein